MSSSTQAYFESSSSDIWHKLKWKLWMCFNKSAVQRCTSGRRLQPCSSILSSERGHTTAFQYAYTQIHCPVNNPWIYCLRSVSIAVRPLSTFLAFAVADSLGHVQMWVLKTQMYSMQVCFSTHIQFYITYMKTEDTRIYICTHTCISQLSNSTHKDTIGMFICLCLCFYVGTQASKKCQLWFSKPNRHVCIFLHVYLMSVRWFLKLWFSDVRIQ